MKIDRLITAIVFLAVLSFAVCAQPKPAPAQQPQASGPVPDAKIALIYSEEFQDPKTGIARFTLTLNNLNREFSARNTEITQLQQRAQALSDDIEKTRNVARPEDTQKKMDQLEQMKKDLQRKGEDAQALYDKRRQDIFQPLQDDIAKAIEAYAKAHGITVIIDGSRVPVIYATNDIDITRQFINEFNSKFPATASAATP